MKFKMVSLVLVFALTISIFSGCGKKAPDEIEMSIDEFAEIWQGVGEKVDEGLEYVPEDEVSEKERELIIENLDGTGLKVGQQITLSGKIRPLGLYDDVYVFSVAKSDYDIYAEDNTWNQILCETNNMKTVLIPEMDNIRVTGTFLGNPEQITISDCAIDAPNLDQLEYEPNISYATSDDSVIMGEVSVILEGEGEIKIFIENIWNSDLISYTPGATYIVITDGSNECLCEIYSESFGEIKVGDKIAVSGFYYDTERTVSGMNGYYIFD